MYGVFTIHGLLHIGTADIVSHGDGKVFETGGEKIIVRKSTFWYNKGV